MEVKKKAFHDYMEGFFLQVLTDLSKKHGAVSVSVLRTTY